MIAGIEDVLAHLAPETGAVVIVTLIYKLIRHAVDDPGRWRRLMFLVVPLLAVAVALTSVAVWWLLGDGGLQIVMHGFGQAATPRH